MAISLVCGGCRSTYNLKAKKCSTCGLDLREKRKYRVRVKVAGRWRSKTLHTLQAARSFELKWLDQKASTGRIEVDRTETLGDIWERFQARVNAQLKAPRRYESLWRCHVAPVLAQKRLGHITPGDIDDLLAQVQAKRVRRSHLQKKGPLKPLSPRTVHYVLQLVRRLFNYAIAQELHDGDNPASRVEAPAYDNEVTNTLKGPQLGRLLATLDGWHNRLAALAFKLCLATGARAGAVFQLSWEDVDMDKGRVVLPLKSQFRERTYELPLSSLAKMVIVEARQHALPGCPLVFHTGNGKRIYYRAIWLRIKKAAGLPHEFRVHDLRHAFACHLANSGKVDIYTLQRLLGHRTIAMTQRYATLWDGTMRDGMEVAAGVFTSENRT